MITRVLVALDRTRRAPHVLEVAAEIAQRFGAALHLLRVIDVPVEIPPAAATEDDPLPKRLVDVATEDLRALASVHAVHAELHVTVDTSPPDAILRVADELDVDLIVMGSHGYAGWDRVLGTNAAAVANRAARNVLVIHDRG